MMAPLYQWGNNLLAYFAERVDSYTFYQTEVWVKSMGTLAVALVTLAVVVVLAWSAATAAFVGCHSDVRQRGGTASGEVPTDQMTYRTEPKTGKQVSILGYGGMRWPTVSKDSARDSNEEIDQEMVNELVDYALAHGVNYFDTSPAYCKGRSEYATGIALKRHPRDTH